ncbi:MAG: DUF1634 domain-containing protein [Gammaproteobacteria bacterium]
MKQTEMLIGRMLRVGLWLSVLIVLIGGALYLMQNGHELIHYSTFQEEPRHVHTMRGILHSALTFSAVGIIQFGLLVLVLTQVLRVAMTVWLFVQERDAVFTWISLIILVILIYSIFWRG